MYFVMEIGTMDTLPSEEEIMNMFRHVATVDAGSVLDIIGETANRLAVPTSKVQETVCTVLSIPPNNLENAWVPSEIDR